MRGTAPAFVPGARLLRRVHAHATEVAAALRHREKVRSATSCRCPSLAQDLWSCSLSPASPLATQTDRHVCPSISPTLLLCTACPRTSGISGIFPPPLAPSAHVKQMKTRMFPAQGKAHLYLSSPCAAHIERTNIGMFRAQGRARCLFIFLSLCAARCSRGVHIISRRTTARRSRTSMLGTRSWRRWPLRASAWLRAGPWRQSGGRSRLMERRGGRTPEDGGASASKACLWRSRM